jgi:hypothetical protein
MREISERWSALLARVLQSPQGGWGAAQIGAIDDGSFTSQAILARVLQQIQKDPRVTTTRLVEAFRGEPFFPRMLELATMPLDEEGIESSCRVAVDAAARHLPGNMDAQRGTHKCTVDARTTGWSTSIETITPDMARYWLEHHNHGNRPIKKSVVAKYAEIMLAGKWITSPEGIIFSSSNPARLLQGQHRLMAIAESGVTIPMLVVRGADESVFSVLDRGITRSAADALLIDKKLSEAARLAVMVAKKRVGAAVSDHQILAAAKVLATPHAMIIGRTQSTAPVFSSAPFRLGACARIMSSNDDRGTEYVLNMYQNLVLGKVGMLPPVAQSLAAAVLAGRVKSSGSQQQSGLLCRAWIVFDESKKDNTRIQINEEQRLLAEVSSAIFPS